MATETTSTLSGAVKTYYERVLLDRLLANYVHGQFAQTGTTRVIPQSGGKTIEWRRYASLTAATTPLTEGSTPAGSNASVTQVTATPGQYGDFITYSDVLELTAVDPVLSEFARMFGEQAGDTLDKVCRDVLAAGTAVQYSDAAGARGSVAASNKFDAAEMLLAVRTLETANVPKFADAMGGSYVCIVHPKTVYDIRNDSAWTNASQYAGSMQVFSGEAGRLYGLRFVETSNAKVFTGAGSGGIDVYGTLILGQDAYGKAAFVGQDMVQFFAKPIGSSGSADPLDQRGSAGWKVSHVSKILNETRMLRVEHAVT